MKIKNLSYNNNNRREARVYRCLMSKIGEIYMTLLLTLLFACEDKDATTTNVATETVEVTTTETTNTVPTSQTTTENTNNNSTTEVNAVSTETTNTNDGDNK